MIGPTQEDEMFERYNFHAMASAAIIVVASSMPLHAEGLRGTVGGALGGLGGAVGDTVGGVNGGVTGSVTSSVGTTKATVGAVTTKGLLSADAKSNILRGIMAKARVLSPEELARLCLATGGGEAGCGSGNKPRILGLIDARLDVLSNKRLISVCASVGAGCGGTSSNVANTTTKLGALNEHGALSADAKSDILRGVTAKARVLSPEELARLCLATGGGEAGCGSGNKPRILGLIDARLNVLSDRRLISVCASVGAGCGDSSSIASVGSNPVIGAIGAEEVPGSTVPGVPSGSLPDSGVPSSSVPAGSVPAGSVPDTSAANRVSQIVGGMSDREVITYKKRCVNVLQSPQRYDSDIVSLCRLIKRQKV
jgi:hypothetical protein